jgi:hypothetical protein
MKESAGRIVPQTAAHLVCISQVDGCDPNRAARFDASFRLTDARQSAWRSRQNLSAEVLA